MPINLPAIVSGASVAQYPRAHDTTHSPVGLWQFNGDLTDASGNGRTLTVNSGSEKYGYILPGLKGIFLDSTALVYDSVADALNIVGDLTVEAIVCSGKCSTTVSSVATVAGGAGENLITNYLFQLAFVPIDGTADGRFQYPQYFAERGAGTNITYALANNPISMAETFHVAMVRSSNQVSFYVNGRQLGATSVGLLAAEKDSVGNTQKLYVGRDGPSGGVVVHMMLCSLKLIASALTADQVRAEFERTIGSYLI